MNPATKVGDSSSSSGADLNKLILAAVHSKADVQNILKQANEIKSGGKDLKEFISEVCS